MNANFWGRMSEEYLQDNPEPPPLTSPYAFALNYNHLGSSGEPTVYCVCLLECERVEVKCLANRFTDFLAGQYFGDEQPTVNLAEAKKYRLLAEGGYEGRYEGTPQPESGILSGLAVMGFNRVVFALSGPLEKPQVQGYLRVGQIRKQT